MGLGHSVDLVRAIWLQPANGFGDVEGRPVEATTAIDASTLTPQTPLWKCGCKQRPSEKEHGPGSNTPLAERQANHMLYIYICIHV